MDWLILTERFVCRTCFDWPVYSSILSFADVLVVYFAGFLLVNLLCCINGLFFYWVIFFTAGVVIGRLFCSRYFDCIELFYCRIFGKVALSFFFYRFLLVLYSRFNG